MGFFYTIWRAYSFQGTNHLWIDAMEWFPGDAVEKCGNPLEMHNRHYFRSEEFADIQLQAFGKTYRLHRFWYLAWHFPKREGDRGGIFTAGRSGEELAKAWEFMMPTCYFQGSYLYAQDGEGLDSAVPISGYIMFTVCIENRLKNAYPARIFFYIDLDMLSVLWFMKK